MDRHDKTIRQPRSKSRPELWDTIMSEKGEPTPAKRDALSTLLIHDELPPLEEAWPVGYRLDDRFEVKDIRGGRGASGMGIVYIVEDDHGNRSAVKTLQRRFRQELQLLQRFVREARTWMLLGVHPNIVYAERLDILEAVPCLFIEFVDSDTNGHHALSQRLNHGPLSPAEVLQVAYQFCRGMIHATRAVPGLVHRDIKPENLLVTPDGTLKITDFGLVRTKAISDDTLEKLSQSEFFDDLPKELTRIGSIFGTPAYMAPEQFMRASDVTFSADIYSLGCCLFEALTGLPPFLVRGDTTVERLVRMKEQHLNADPPSIRDAVGDTCPPALERIIRRCLAKDPEKRWDSFEDLSIALLSLMDTLDVVPRDVPCPNPTPREIAEQARSITLLDGYDQAIHMRKLREGQEDSPYAFHLALASYFHCTHDEAEEERQLSKALGLSGDQEGYESLRRISELWIRQGNHERADVILTAYLKKSPEKLEHVLEPAVRAACGRHDYDRALRLATGGGNTFRSQLLRAEVYRAQGDTQALGTLLRTLHGAVLEGLQKKIEHLEPTDTVGWGRADDPFLLETVLDSLLPDVDVTNLRRVTGAVWPDIGGYPDFAPDMAWLSFTLGELAKVSANCMPDAAKTFGEFATFLGYPSRLEKHLERDEYWFWMRESQSAKRAE